MYLGKAITVAAASAERWGAQRVSMMPVRTYILLTPIKSTFLTQSFKSHSLKYSPLFNLYFRELRHPHKKGFTNFGDPYIPQSPRSRTSPFPLPSFPLLRSPPHPTTSQQRAYQKTPLRNRIHTILINLLPADSG